MRIAVLVSLILVCCSATNLPPPLSAADFARDDCVLILVSGPAAQSTPWGLSGKASLYRATSTTGKGKLVFSPVEGATDVPCERRSAKKVLEPFDYGQYGQIPPGMYFVSYHRLDNDGRRHRLAIGDNPNGTTIRLRVAEKDITRTDIQFHEASNDLRRYSPRLSEGCIIFSAANFSKLFPPAFLEPRSSPLRASSAKTPSAQKYVGEGRVLAFVTDSTNTTTQKRQLALFQQVQDGGNLGLTQKSFRSDSDELTAIRTQWLGR